MKRFIRWLIIKAEARKIKREAKRLQDIEYGYTQT
jgi:hypothetical protein